MLKTDRKTVLLLHGRRKNAGEEQNVPNRLLTNPAMFPLEIMVMIAIRAGTVDAVLAWMYGAWLSMSEEKE